MKKNINIDEIDDAVLGQRVKKLYKLIESKPLGTHHYYLEISSGIKGLLGDEEQFQHELEMVSKQQDHYEKFCKEMDRPYGEEDDNE